ncbi:hypothetical protein [Dyadobacter sp. NIV53]|uniref:hypothetical protein n=1 Tax=Dyadobacter sp. NIV53 TaxID=2861765 RepID=UPI001C8766D4|nr:hypothetical protein [Dyadobacter sp. NIV53]
MAGTCTHINPLQHSGSSQLQRLLKALEPSFVKIDERSTADLMLFAKEYARYIKYYNASNVSESDWQAFMQWDISAVLAELSKTNAQFFYKIALTIIAKLKTPLTEAEAQQHFTLLFELLFTLLQRIDQLLVQIPNEMAFREYFQTLIESRIQEPYKKLKKQYDNALANVPTPLVLTDSGLRDSLAIPLETVANATSGLNTALWGDPSLAIVPAFIGANVPEKVKNMASHNLFIAQIDSLFRAIAQLNQQAGLYLEQTLDNFPDHTPHYALFLTFLKLFKGIQNNLNEFTKRHLDFYYKDILQLKNKASQPDFVHLIIELAKNTDKFLLAKDTVFKAGKNDAGKELFYKSTSDTVINQAQAALYKSVFVETSATEKSVYASATANSIDGQGGKITAADGQWKPFGDDTRKPATVGFAVASHHFYCQGGGRILGIFFEKDGAPVSVDVSLFDIHISGEKGWFIIPDSQKGVLGSIIWLYLNPNDPAFVPFSQKLHADTFNTVLPVAKFTFKNTSNARAWYDLGFTKITTGCWVGGLKKFSLSNDLGPLDPAKPFLPFGGIPKKGAGFTIGSHEVFQKYDTTGGTNVLNAGLSIEWDNAAIAGNNVSVRYLDGGQWTIPAGNRPDTDIKFSNPHPIAPDFSPDVPLTTDSKRGFVRFETDTDFGHGDYIKRLVDSATNATVNDTPAQPYTPQIKSLAINYIFWKSFDLSGTTLLNESELQFFHVLPFGTKKPVPQTGLKLLPAFDNEGELYVGFEKLTPDSSLSTLFQLAEGSADPELDKTEVVFDYLANNSWKTFDSQSISDGTEDLIHSGIVQTQIPADAGNTNTILDSGFHWLRLTVKERTAAACNIIGIHTQAVRATFFDYNKQGIVFEKSLAGNTISKTVISNAAIKKMSQPYNSFGGRVTETDPHFYVRVSERLRHKQRGITIWDYEHIVLEAFPDELYKVKCLNHTHLQDEIAPGYVTVVPVANLQNKNAIDPLRPLVNIATLEKISQFLKKIISAHVRLDVRNPKFEQVQFEFSVKFIEDPAIDPSYYREVLNRRVEEFLAPWAYNTAWDIEFGGHLCKSVVLNLVEEQTYVDYVTCFKMNHYVDGIIYKSDVEEAYTTSSRSVITSYKNGNTRHIITVLTSADKTCVCV